MRQSDRAFRTMIFFSRWLLAPFLIGLLGGVVLLLYRFFADLAALAMRAPGEGWHDLVVGVLNLIDIALTGNLVVIVIFSGYENFIHQIERDENPDLPGGLVNVDFAALKEKILGSIAVIAAVDALAWYLDLERANDLSKLGWVIGFPLMFVVALLILTIADHLGRHGARGSD